MLRLRWNPPDTYTPQLGILISYNSLDDIFNNINVQVKKIANIRCGIPAEPFNHNLLFELSNYNDAINNFKILIGKNLDLECSQEILYSKTPLHKGNLDEGTSREVYPIFTDTRLSFRAGLTVHSTNGTWSSLPHHFERKEILRQNPTQFFEKFAYVTSPEGSEGIQVRTGHLFSENDRTIDYKWANELVSIKDKDILDIPLGSHPVTAGPGVRLAYFWFYADPNNLRGREKFEDGDTSD